MNRVVDQAGGWFLIAAAVFLPYASVWAGSKGPYDCVIEPRTTVELGSSAEGILLDVLVARGDVVHKGMPVARLESELERIAVELAHTKAENDADLRSRKEQLVFRRKEVQRLKSIRSKKLATEREYDEALVERTLAQLSLEAARVNHALAQIERRRADAMLNRREIQAPVDGIVVDVAMSPGEFVHEQSVLLSIAELDPLFVEVFMPVSEYRSVSKGMRARVKPEEPIGGVYDAEVAIVDSVFDAASRTFGVRLKLSNEGYKLPGGLRCKLEFQDRAEGGIDHNPVKRTES